MTYFIQCLKKYAVFKGRARRKEYWLFVFSAWLIGIGVLVCDAVIFGSSGGSLFGIYQIGLFVPTIAVLVRRMHDVDKSGWFCFPPIYNLLLACTEGTKGPNRFGPDPKAANQSEGLESPLPPNNKQPSLRNL